MTPPDRTWARRGLDADAYESLAARLSPSELWSLLLDVLEQRAARRTPATLMAQWGRDPFTQPSYVDQRTHVEIDAHLLAAAAAFEAVELSPLAPLGVCSVLGLTSQNKIVSALRGTEVVSDPTNALALECARRLGGDPDRTVRLATCHRCVRGQEVPKQPGFAQHFRVFCLASAARECGSHGFLVNALVEQITTMAAALDRLERHGYAFEDRKVAVLATQEREQVADRVADALAVPVTRGPLGHRYYGGVRFQISVRDHSRDTDVPLIDGGAFDWVAKLASNRKLVFVASGMGAQLVPFLFRRP
jgi:hypothetical protein